MSSTTRRSASLGSTSGSSSGFPTPGGGGVIGLINKFETHGTTCSNAQNIPLSDEIVLTRPRAYSGEHRRRKIQDLKSDSAVAATRARTPRSLSIRKTDSRDSLRLLQRSPLRNSWSAEEVAKEPAGVATKLRVEMVTMDKLMAEVDALAEEIRQGFPSP